MAALDLWTQWRLWNCGRSVDYGTADCRLSVARPKKKRLVDPLLEQRDDVLVVVGDVVPVDDLEEGV
ncbi:MAG: hypothetical protein ABEJ90_05480, partial [Halobacterium sp.]